MVSLHSNILSGVEITNMTIKESFKSSPVLDVDTLRHDESEMSQKQSNEIFPSFS